MGFRFEVHLSSLLRKKIRKYENLHSSDWIFSYDRGKLHFSLFFERNIWNRFQEVKKKEESKETTCDIQTSLKATKRHLKESNYYRVVNSRGRLLWKFQPNRFQRFYFDCARKKSRSRSFEKWKWSVFQFLFLKNISVISIN